MLYIRSSECTHLIIGSFLQLLSLSSTLPTSSSKLWGEASGTRALRLGKELRCIPGAPARHVRAWDVGHHPLWPAQPAASDSPPTCACWGSSRLSPQPALCVLTKPPARSCTCQVRADSWGRAHPHPAPCALILVSRAGPDLPPLLTFTKAAQTTLQALWNVKAVSAPQFVHGSAFQYLKTSTWLYEILDQLVGDIPWEAFPPGDAFLMRLLKKVNCVSFYSVISISAPSPGDFCASIFNPAVYWIYWVVL